MKKRLALLLAAILAVGTLATACGGNGGSNGTVKVGLGAHTDFTYGSHNHGDKDYSGNAYTTTNAQADIHVATVMLDAEGKILQCKIDAVQVAAEVNEKGEIITDTATKFQTKKEKGEGYAMKGKSPIGLEWDEQIEKYEKWCEGKTAADITAAVGEDGKPTDEELLMGCTIKINCIERAIVRACENAVESKASADDTLGLGMTAALSSARNYGEVDKDGNVLDGTIQAYVNFASTTKNANGEITNVIIDSIQAYSTWDAEGKLTTDMTKEPITKYDQKEGYGMKGKSAEIGVIEGGGEWFEQIDKFEAYITGKTSEFVTSIAINEEGKPTDENLTAGCTMTITAYQEAVAKALAN